MTTTINASTSSGLVNTADTSGILQLQTASTAALTIDASQNTTFAGIQKSSLTSGNFALADQATTGTLFQQIQNSGVTLKIGTENSSGGGIFTGSGSFDAVIGTSSNRNLSFGVFGATKMTLANTGNLLLGTTTDPAYSGFTTLAVNSATGALIDLQRAGTRIGSLQTNSTDELRLYAASGVFTSYYAGGSERMRIDSSGNLLVGTTSQIGSAGTHNIVSTSNNWALLVRNSSASAGKYWVASPNSSNAYYVTNNSGVGVYITDGATSWTGTSDERLKNITGEISDGLNKVNSLRAVQFSWKSDNSNTEQVGLIAQDVQKVLPQAISEDNDGNLGIRYTEVIPLLVASIKELKAINDTQAETINALTARIVALESK